MLLSNILLCRQRLRGICGRLSAQESAVDLSPVTTANRPCTAHIMLALYIRSTMHSCVIVFLFIFIYSFIYSFIHLFIQMRTQRSFPCHPDLNSQPPDLIQQLLLCSTDQRSANWAISTTLVLQLAERWSSLLSGTWCIRSGGREFKSKGLLDSHFIELIWYPYKLVCIYLFIDTFIYLSIYLLIHSHLFTHTLNTCHAHAVQELRQKREL